ncbi:MAG TPA: GAF domain-containing protein, partial [Candidatus Limnocylindria bacterium]|nr:GAF domain-containing protein [Candidatus Limnocylindria bacterium]
MRRFPRSLRLYIAASSIYAALVFIAVHAVYGFELGRAGIQLPDAGSVIGSIEAVSAVVWIGISLIAATVLYRLAVALEGAQSEERQRQGEIASIFALGQALSGSLEFGEIAERFLGATRGALGGDVTTAIYVQDDSVEGFRLLGEQGPGAGRLWGEHYTAAMVPGPIRARVIDHRQSLVLPDTQASEAWPPIAASLAAEPWIRSFAALPLVSHDRLVGLAVFASPTSHAITADGLQLVALTSQFAGAAIRTALSFAEATARGKREAIVNRVAQQARA